MDALLPSTKGTARTRGRASAFTLVEVVFVLAILLTGMGMFVHTITSTSKLGPRIET